MESNDSYPVFHTRLVRTLRRRLTRPDGTSAGWLIFDADHVTEIATTPRTEPDPDDDAPSVTVPHPR